MVRRNPQFHVSFDALKLKDCKADSSTNQGLLVGFGSSVGDGRVGSGQG